MNKESEMNMTAQEITAQEITGCLIKRLRIKKGYSQTRLAEMVGYKDKTAIAKIEAGKVDLPLSKMMAFSTALSTDMYYLLGNVSDMEEPQFIVPQELKTIEVDVEKRIFKVNGKPFGEDCKAFAISCDAVDGYRIRMAEISKEILKRESFSVMYLVALGYLLMCFTKHLK